MRRLSIVAAALVFASSNALAVCPPSCPIPGGGKADVDCHVELASTAMRINTPFHNPNKVKPGKGVSCFDGEPGCDLDGEVNNSCTFDVDLCLYNNDPALPTCSPADVTAVAVKGATKDPNLGALQSDIDALLPASASVCTTGNTVVVPLKGPNGKGAYKAGKLTFGLKAETATAKDVDKVKFACIPHRWPGHGYNGANHRSTNSDITITTANVSSLQEKWRFEVPSDRAVTSTPTVGKRHVYTTSWDGTVYALDKKKGKVKWSFDTPGAVFSGVQSSVAIAADGRVVVGDSAGNVYAFDGKKGTLLWESTVADTDPGASAIWGSPAIANGRVFVPRASHNDVPCTRGHVYAFDLDTGDEIWRYATVSERVCYDDTTIACTSDTDCVGGAGSLCVIGGCATDFSMACVEDSDCPTLFGSPGDCLINQCGLEQSISCSVDGDCPTCVPAVGGGVTATPAIGTSGDDVYIVSVGCLSRPSVGNSDSIIRLDGATGAEQWVHRTRNIEQFSDGFPYHDYGFLNGPILTDIDDGLGGTTSIVVAGSKDGTLYAVDADSGAAVWTNELAPAPAFGEFGLFNAAVGYADGSFYAALFSFSNWPPSNDHLYSFNATDGTTNWSDQIGGSWGDAAVVNGVLYVGTQAAGEFYAYDAASGVRLHTIPVPAGTVTGGAAVDNGVLFVPYGTALGSGGGGVIAFELP